MNKAIKKPAPLKERLERMRVSVRNRKCWFLHDWMPIEGWGVPAFEGSEECQRCGITRRAP